MELRKRKWPNEFHHSPQPASEAPKLQKHGLTIVLSHIIYMLLPYPILTDHNLDYSARPAKRRSTRITAAQQAQTQKKQPTIRLCGECKERPHKSVLQKSQPALDILKKRKTSKSPLQISIVLFIADRIARIPFETYQIQGHEYPTEEGAAPREQARKSLRVDQSEQGVSTIYSCPQCSFPCWICNSATIPQEPVPDVAQVVEEEAEEQDPMDSRTTTSGATQTTKSSTKRNRNDGLKYIGPKEKDFEMCILGAINCFLKKSLASSYSRPEDVPDSSLQQKSKLDATQVFLDIDQSEIPKMINQIQWFDDRAYDETTLTMDIARYFAPTDYYVSLDGPETVVSLCRYKWKPGKALQGPSIPIKSGYTYDWDIEPDMTYMVSVNLFPEDIRERMHTPDLLCVLAEPAGVCPYLTFEFKCAEKTGNKAEARCQIAAASLLWIYQRKQIRDMLQLSNTSDLRHYSIIIISTVFYVWVTLIDGSRFWVRNLDEGYLNKSEGIEKYVKWWNAIHTWGLGAHAQSFKKDVEALWEKKQGNRVAIAPTPPLSEDRAAP